MLGAVIAPAIGILSSQPREYGIQLVGRDPYTKEEVAKWCGVISRGIVTQEPFTAFYFPTYEQRATAEADRAWLEAQGFPDQLLRPLGSGRHMLLSRLDHRHAEAYQGQ